MSIGYSDALTITEILRLWIMNPALVTPELAYGFSCITDGDGLKSHLTVGIYGLDSLGLMNGLLKISENLVLKPSWLCLEYYHW